MKKKILSLTLVVCLLAIAVVGGTLAYFTDKTEVAENTFTVGDVEITLDEADVDEYGDVVTNDRVLENEYKLIPGHTYVKDPTVYVDGGSEPAYVRMLVTVEGMEKLQSVFTKKAYPEYYKGDLFLLQQLCYDEEGTLTWDKTKWECVGVNEDGAYEFRYTKVVDAREVAEDDVETLEPLFTAITLPGELTDEQVGLLDELKINVKAEAIQADGFDDADDAFAALNAQGAE